MNKVQDELSQWCEIDGHSWIIQYSSYGMVLSPKTEITHKHCINCKKQEQTVFIPEDNKFQWPIFRKDF